MYYCVSYENPVSVTLRVQPVIEVFHFFCNGVFNRFTDSFTAKGTNSHGDSFDLTSQQGWNIEYQSRNDFTNIYTYRSIPFPESAWYIAAYIEAVPYDFDGTTLKFDPMYDIDHDWGYSSDDPKCPKWILEPATAGVFPVGKWNLQSGDIGCSGWIQFTADGCVTYDFNLIYEGGNGTGYYLCDTGSKTIRIQVIQGQGFGGGGSGPPTP